MAVTLVLPTPPSSPPYSSCRLIVNHSASTGPTSAALLATLPSQPNSSQDKSESTSRLAAYATITTNDTSSQRTAATKNVAEAAGAAGRTPQRSVVVLKEDLHIVGWRCGAQTVSNTECRRPISNATKQLIDSQLATMICFTRASPGFDHALLELVMLVHCYQHDAGIPKERRHKAWKCAFPPGSVDGSEPETPLEQRIRTALGPLGVECSSRDNGRTCKSRVGGQKVQNCERTIQELVKPAAHSSDTKLEFLLKVLEWNSTCSNHESSTQFIWVAAWKKNVMAVLPAPEMLSRAQLTQPIAITPPTTEEKDLAVLRVLLPCMQALPESTMNLVTDPALYWPKVYDTSAFEIIKQPNTIACSILPYKAIRSEISRALKEQDLHAGYIYAYEVDGNNGYVKIGYTKRSVIDRHDEWSFDCNRQTKSLYPSLPSAAISTSDDITATTAVLALHARRIEALCHAELNHRRVKIYCRACLKQHIEWFRVSAAEAAAVIQKWTRWMATRPYELPQLRHGSKWMLKTSEVQRTARIEQFMRELVVVQEDA